MKRTFVGILKSEKDGIVQEINFTYSDPYEDPSVVILKIDFGNEELEKVS